MAQQTKKQHTVPQCYLKNFSADGLKIFGKEKISDTNPNIPRNYELKKGKYIESQTIVLDQYTLNNSPDPMIIERDFYAYKTEKDYSELYNILIDPNVTTITPLERCKIFTSMLSLHCRTKKQFDLFIEIAKEFTTPEDLIKAKQDYKVAHLEMTLLNFIAAHQNKAIAVITISDHTEFLTSDNPILIINKKEENKNWDFREQFNPDNQIILPINPKTCVVFAQAKKPKDLFIIHRMTRDIKYVQEQNFMQIHSAEKTIYGSENYIKMFFTMVRLA